MKISNLKIFDIDSNLVQDIDFNINGLSYVLGDIVAPKDNNKTSNSIGKTLLLKLVDYILGAKEDKNIIKDAIKQYKIQATVFFNEQIYTVERTLGVPNSIYIDGELTSLENYKKFFEIERSLISRQVVLQSKQNIISFLPHPNIEDYRAILTLLNLTEICSTIILINELQNKYKGIEANKEQLVSLLGIDSNKVADEIFFNEKEIDVLTIKANKLEKEIATLKINSENTSLQDEFSKLNSQVKKIRNELFELLDEKKSLEKFLNDSASSNLDGSIIKLIYEKAKIELPSAVIKSFDEVDAFYKAINEDRIQFAKERINKIDLKISEHESVILSIEKRLDSISDILSTNDAYKNAIEILHDYNTNLQALKYKQGQLSQISSYIVEQEAVDKSLLEAFAQLQVLKGKFDETNKKYKNFVFEIVRKIYDSSMRASFDIIFKEYNRKNHPINLQMEITGDAGEGVKEVKKTIMDYLVFYFNNKVDVFIHDSSCYNGVDPRQVRGLLKELTKMCEENQKQVIISINKYQMGEDGEFLNEVVNNSCIKLSETNKLLGFDF